MVYISENPILLDDLGVEKPYYFPVFIQFSEFCDTFFRCRDSWQKDGGQVIQAVTFLYPSWRSLNPLKGSLNHPKKVTLNHQGVVNTF